MSEPMTAGWPRLTESLPTVEWGRCQRCGTEGELGEGLRAWQEHDDRDRREPRAVVLCESCSEEIIEPHPRLYRQLHPWAPLPGVMELCEGCIHRDGYLCGHPDLTIHGGEGLAVSYPKPIRAHVYGGPGGRSGWKNVWQGPPTGCAGKETAP